MSIVFVCFLIFACVFKNVNKLDSGMRVDQNTLGECHRHGNLVRKEMKGFRTFIVLGVLARMLADVQMNVVGSGMHVQWFSCWKIRADDHDIIS